MIDNYEPVEPVEVPDKKMVEKPKGHNPAGDKGLTPGHTKSQGNGRKSRVTEAAYLEAFKEVVGIDEYKAMIRTHLGKARKGDFRAFQELVRQAQGKPKEQIVIETTQMDNLSRLKKIIKGEKEEE